MKHRLAASASVFIAQSLIAPVCLLGICGAALAQSGRPELASQNQLKPQIASQAVPALLLSDIHFDPFWDPAKLPQLAAAPPSAWRAILAAAPSPDQPQRFAALQQSCHVRGADTSFALFDSSLKAMRAHAAGAKFVTVSGDLLAHAFDCKYKALVPNSTLDNYRAFVEKSIDYVMDELYGTYPNVPVYIALGNNDSDCGDYRLDPHSEFLAAVAKEVTKDFSTAERQAAEVSFAAGGYYAASLPSPIQNARLLVLNDIFMSKSYATCSGKPDTTAAEAQLAWLRQQLAEARANKQKVWVMGHIPPGVDLYATASKMIDVCGGRDPVMFLSSEILTDALTDSADVIELAIFAHTHMDEIKLLKAETPDAHPAVPQNITAETKGVAAESKAIAMKEVSSISPINGNRPSITLAQVDPTTAVLRDYKVFTASNRTGVDAIWSEEYDFNRSYNEAEFDKSSVHHLITGFAADSGAKTQPSRSYIQDFSTGSRLTELQMFWPEYVCSLSNHTRQSFRACVCPAAH
jgi:sphingomyelin phosphodiesterase acid-like 3